MERLPGPAAKRRRLALGLPDPPSPPPPEHAAGEASAGTSGRLRETGLSLPAALMAAALLVLGWMWMVWTEWCVQFGDGDGYAPKLFASPALKHAV